VPALWGRLRGRGLLLRDDHADRQPCGLSMWRHAVRRTWAAVAGEQWVVRCGADRL